MLQVTGTQLAAFDELDASSAPLGCALVCLLDADPLGALARSLAAVARSPWCPLILVTSQVLRDEFRHLVESTLGKVAIHYHPPGKPNPSIPDLRHALARRGPPTIAEFTGFVRRRAGRPVADVVERALGGSGQWTPSLRRLMVRLGLPSPQHWFNLHQLTRYLAAGAPPHSRTLEQVALEHDRSPRTLSGWCARYLRCSWTVAQERLGWEWALETVLRSSGCCPPPPRSRGWRVHHVARWTSPRIKEVVPRD